MSPTRLAVVAATACLALGLAVAALVLAVTDCPCGCTHGGSHGHSRALTPLEEPAGQRDGRGLTVA